MFIPSGNTYRPPERTCSPTPKGSPRPTAFTRADARGFTLLEILVAIFIFAIVMTTIYAAFNAAVSRNEAIEQGRGLYSMARICLDRMTRDLSAIYVEMPPQYEPPDFDDDPDPYRFEGIEEIVGSEDFSRLRFAADAHLPMGGEGASGLAEIVYYVDRAEDAATGGTGMEGPGGGYVLRRSDTAFPYDLEELPEAKLPAPILCKGVSEFTLTYYDASGETVTTWDSEADIGDYATPRAVGIELEISDGKTSKKFNTTVRLPVYRQAIEEERTSP